MSLNREADRTAQRMMNDAAMKVNEWQHSNIAVGGVCDFCAHPIPELGGEAAMTTWVTDAPIIGAMSGLADTDAGLGAATAPAYWSPEWGACPACSAVIEQHDPEALMRYVMEHASPNAIPPELLKTHRAIIEDDMTALYREFFARNPKKVEA